nr:nucleoside hydrolase [Devosia aurantiaca]
MNRKVIIDTDPGLDDAVAILFALASDRFEVLGLTTVAGNIGLARTTANAGACLPRWAGATFRSWPGRRGRCGARPSMRSKSTAMTGWVASRSRQQRRS